MKKAFKSALSLLLCMIMIIGTLIPTIAAKGNDSSQAAIEQDGLRLESTNAVGKVLAKAASEQVESSESYGIVGVDINGSTVAVEINNADACTVLVAVYDDDSGRMVGSGFCNVEQNAGSVDVELNISSLPDYYLLRAFLLDDELASLCEEYRNIEHTHNFIEAKEKTVDDFPDNIVLNLDETKDNNFAVVADNGVEITTDGVKNVLISSENDVYEFNNIDSQFDSLKDGDVISYTDGDKSSFVIKISAINIQGDKAIINSDTNASIDELFDFLKVDAGSDGDGEKMSVDMDGVEDGITYEGMEKFDEMPRQSPAKAPQKSKVDVSSTLDCPVWNISKKFGYTGDGSGIGTGEASIEFKLQIKVGISYSLKAYYDADWEWKWDFWNSLKTYYYFESTFDFSAKATGSVTGKLSKEFYLGAIDFVTPCGITCGIGFRLVFAATGSISLDIQKYSFKIGFRYDNESGFRNLSSKPEKEVMPSLSGEISVSLSLKASPNISLIKIVEVAINPEAGIRITGVPLSVNPVDVITGKPDESKVHTCSLCIDGSIKLFYTVSVSGRIFAKKASITLVSTQEWTVAKFYYSASTGKLELGKTCPNILYLVTFTVVDKSGNAVKDASVDIGDGTFYEFNGTKPVKVDGVSALSDDKGVVKAYYANGKHTVTASKDGAKEAISFNVKDADKPIRIVLDNGSGGETGGGETGGESGSGSAVGDIITFGSYPQSEVTKESDSATYARLEAATKNWVSYEYYSGNGDFGSMQPGNWMEYADMDINGDGANDYRAVRFTQYRPDLTFFSFSSDSSRQYDNGYTVNNIYYFKYELLKWQVLDPNKGLVLSKSIIDSQAYSNTIYVYGTDAYGKTAYWNNASYTKYANDYATSSIRKWLNEDFYNTAFTSTQKQNILPTTLDNKAYSTTYGKFDSVSTTDNVFLLSWMEVQNTSYGFTNSFMSTETREARGTDYAKAQNLWVHDTYDCSEWLLRSAGDDSICACQVSIDGFVYYSGGVYGTSSGIRPALRLSSLATNKSISARAHSMRVPASEVLSPNLQNTVYTATAQNAVPGELYMLYAFSSDTDLSSLEYVAQLRAESSEVKFRYIPRNLGDLNVVIVGKFSDGSAQEPVEPEYGVERLELISPPAKTEYDYLSSPVADLSGLRLKAVYSDGAEKEITDLQDIKASEVDTSKLGDQEITLTYEGVSIQIAVTVVPRKFKLVWIVDGSQTELTAAEGSKITKPVDPELEGYVFKGWSPEVPETMPAQDIIFTARFEPVKCSVIVPTPPKSTLNYGETLVLKAYIYSLPAGARIVWKVVGRGAEIYPAKDGRSCEIKATGNGKVMILATVVDNQGVPLTYTDGSRAEGMQEITTKDGLFLRIAAFFKKLFGSNIIIPYALEWITK